MNYQYNPNFNGVYMTEEGIMEKRSLSKDCSKLGLLLLTYVLTNTVFAYGFYYATYYVLAKSFTLSYNTVVNYLVDNHKALVTSTAYSMSANITVTVLSLAVILLMGKVMLKVSFNGFIKPSKQGAKTAAVWIPGCFVINIALSLAVSYLTAFLNTQGIAVPTSDFTISSPSAASLTLQFIYVVLLGPFIEEFIYRGLILGMLSKYGNSAAILLSALAFGLMHGNIPQAVSAFGTGLVYAIIAVNCGSIFPTILLHIANNIISSYTEFADVLNIPHSDLIFSIFEITIALFGFLVLFTKIKELRYKDGTNALDKKTVSRTVFRNPVILAYLALLIFQILRRFFFIN